ncbi:MBL fold metallo-hydrolase [Gaopeijia maritima]|uniref:MBL fold metallo-hydrolase n=1 Tax=Gaopeijia maritima TaxID=3119007 RepID=A0ABU9EBH6_9BACT
MSIRSLPSRRALLALAIGLSSNGCAAPDAAVATDPARPDPAGIFRFEPLDDGVWAALVLPRPEAWAFANSLVVIGDDGVLVVDTQQSPTAARALVERIREWTDLPVRWVVNTHWHGDHHYGNVAYRDAWPDARFLAHPATVDGMRSEGAAQREAEMGRLPGSIADAERWLEAGALPDGRVVEGELREGLEYSLRLRRSYLEELRTLEFVEPEPWVSEIRRIDVGGRVVELHPLGPAHTGGDVVVRIPDAGIAAVGDLLESTALPWIDGMASATGWAAALDALAELDDRIHLPAHGEIDRGGALLAMERAVFRDAVSGEGEGLDRHRPFFTRVGADDEAARRWWEAVREAASGRPGGYPR